MRKSFENARMRKSFENARMRKSFENARMRKSFENARMRKSFENARMRKSFENDKSVLTEDYKYLLRRMCPLSRVRNSQHRESHNVNQQKHGTFEPAGFAAPLGYKDIRLTLAAAEDLRVPLPLASLLRDRFLTLLAHGGDKLDWSAIGQLAAKDAGEVEV
jgi:NADP-dependent 3-hydroxyisobutyrate dehydrogenase-like protein